MPAFGPDIGLALAGQPHFSFTPYCQPLFFFTTLYFLPPSCGRYFLPPSWGGAVKKNSGSLFFTIFNCFLYPCLLSSLTDNDGLNVNLNFQALLNVFASVSLFFVFTYCLTLMSQHHFSGRLPFRSQPRDRSFIIGRYIGHTRRGRGARGCDVTSDFSRPDRIPIA